MKQLEEWVPEEGDDGEGGIEDGGVGGVVGGGGRSALLCICKNQIGFQNVGKKTIPFPHSMSLKTPIHILTFRE